MHWWLKDLYMSIDFSFVFAVQANAILSSEECKHGANVSVCVLLFTNYLFLDE